MDKRQLTEWLKAAAFEEGFDLSGVCPAVAPEGIHRFQHWLAAGYAGEMSYLETRRDAYQHPDSVLDGARSILMLGLRYQTKSPAEPVAGAGRVACYAWGEVDYHDLIHARLKRLVKQFTDWCPEAAVRGVVDTAPLLEREFAQMAGLGWIGKNTLLLNQDEGSWFFLAALLTDQELEYDAPFAADHCGTCTACLDACPTNAFPRPYVLDATRCISYLTIELRNGIPADLRDKIGGWVFGCDICQEVCPWNRKAPLSREPEFAPRSDQNPLPLAELFWLDDESFRTRFRKTPLWRSKRRGLLRNAAICLGNAGSRAALPALERGLTDSEPLVREASAWALGRIATPESRSALEAQLATEADPIVVESIRAALTSLG